MTFDATHLESQLITLLNDDKPARWLVAYSGGLDSTVLLHALCSLSDSSAPPIIAVHVDHGLHKESSHWTAHCATQARSLGVDFAVLAADVERFSGCGPEAAAREARYAVLREMMLPGDCLLTAHHETDQAETLMLNLLRGSGIAGLAGIGSRNDFGAGLLLRPMLGAAKSDIQAYALLHGLDWIDDPSNVETCFDRNFIRHEVLPVLARRWPAVTGQLSQSARYAGECSELLRDLAALDFSQHRFHDRLSLSLLKQLSKERQRNLIRYALRRNALPPAPATCIREVVDVLIPARTDAQPLVTWSGGEFRRYQDELFILPNRPDEAPRIERTLLLSDEPLPLGPGMGTLQLSDNVENGFDPFLAQSGMTVRYREGGETIRPAGHSRTRKLKKLLQQEGVLPWMRNRLPLLYSGDRLIAVADLWIDEESVVNQGLGVRWSDRPSVM